jgi:hypothetical protein
VALLGQSHHDLLLTMIWLVLPFYLQKFPAKRLYDERDILSMLPSGLRTEMLLELNEVASRSQRWRRAVRDH